MPDIPVDGTTRVAYVPAISNQAGPTVAELNAGLLLQTTLTADGLMGYEPDTADVDNSSLASTFDTVTIGRDSFSNTGLRLKKQSGTDTIYATLQRGVTGYTVIRRYVPQATAWAAGQNVEVFPIICGSRKPIAPEKNTVSRYEVPTKITDSASVNAVVAA